MIGIITFYSYKGGVGRSMALANLTVLLARRGLRVLVVDFDLEAPGLERYFADFALQPGGPGLLRLCMAARDHGGADYTEFTTSFDAGGAHPVTLLASGRDVDADYSHNLEEFDWEEFFTLRGGGAFIESLRGRWREDFDVVLIDSRTGLSDTGGICTIQLPDIVVAMFTANFQSLYGVRDLMRLAQRARQSLAYDRMPLSVLPLPTRWGVQELEESQRWLDRIAEATAELFADWLPRELSPRDVLEAIKIPQVAYFGFGERLAVVEHGVADPQGMGFAYDRIAGFLASGFRDVAALVGAAKLATATPPVALIARGVEEPPDGYLYDVFVSYPEASTAWVMEVVRLIELELTDLRPARPRIFADVREIEAARWAPRISDALNRSKVMLAFISPSYAMGQAGREFEIFDLRAQQTGCPVLVPVLLQSGAMPSLFEQRRWLDLTRYRGRSSTRSAALRHELHALARRLNECIDLAPPFDPSWLAGDDDAPAVAAVTGAGER